MLIGKYTAYYQSPLDPWSTLVPLLLVLTLSMCKEGFEDLKRHRADKDTNNRIAHKIINDKQQITADTYWQNIAVGDIILLDNNHEIPADVVLLCSSDETGVVYIETSNIDGETNLKIKSSARSLSTANEWKTPADVVGYVYC
jgi:phospholipid-transporting ATPase